MVDPAHRTGDVRGWLDIPGGGVEVAGVLAPDDLGAEGLRDAGEVAAGDPGLLVREP